MRNLIHKMDLFIKLLTCCMLFSCVVTEDGCTMLNEDCSATWLCDRDFDLTSKIIQQRSQCGTSDLNYTVILSNTNDTVLDDAINILSSPEVQNSVHHIVGVSNRRNISFLNFSPLLNVVSINFTANDFENVNLFIIHPSLKRLVLSHIHIKELTLHVRSRSTDSLLEYLDVSYNRLFSININRWLNNLIELRLEYNEIEHISELKLEQLKKLRYLNIMHNRITNMLVLPHLSQLYHLDVSQNSVTKLKLTAENLQYLNMSYNCVEDMDFNIFHKLETLDLSHNQLRGSKGLKDVDTLVYLDLSYNNLGFNVSLPEPYFPSHIQYLNVNNNYLSKLTINIFKYIQYLKNVTMSHQNITFVSAHVFVGTNIQHLNLSHNIISHISDIRGGNSSLITLDLSYNKINSIDFLFNVTSFLTEVYLNNNLLTTVPSNIFSTHKEIQKLDISDNKIIHFNQNLQDLNNLQFFNAHNNELNITLTKDLFSPSIVDLDLSMCQFKIVSSLTFANLMNMKSLNISHNNLVYINPMNFDDVNFMDSLDLSFNNLTQLELNTSINLNIVYLNNNNLKSIPTVFITRLEFMNLSHNIIADVMKDTFLYTNELKILDLSFNKIRELTNESFQYLKELKQLNLSSNLIERLAKGCFDDLRENLEIINLSRNRLKYFDMDIFTALYELKELIIDYNYLKITSADIVLLIKSLSRTLSLGGNLIACEDIDNAYTFLEEDDKERKEIVSLDKVYNKDNYGGIECVKHASGSTTWLLPFIYSLCFILSICIAFFVYKRYGRKVATFIQTSALPKYTIQFSNRSKDSSVESLIVRPAQK